MFPRFLDGKYRLLIDRLSILPDVGVPWLALLRLAVGRSDLSGAVGVVHVTVDGSLVYDGAAGRRPDVGGHRRGRGLPVGRIRTCVRL